MDNGEQQRDVKPSDIIAPGYLTDYDYLESLAYRTNKEEDEDVQNNPAI